MLYTCAIRRMLLSSTESWYLRLGCQEQEWMAKLDVQRSIPLVAGNALNDNKARKQYVTNRVSTHARYKRQNPL